MKVAPGDPGDGATTTTATSSSSGSNRGGTGEKEKRGAAEGTGGMAEELGSEETV